MNDKVTRDRKSAVFDKKRSITNYIKLEDKKTDKISNIKRLTGFNNTDLINFIEQQKNQISNTQNTQSSVPSLPKPPQFTNDLKLYTNDKDIKKLQLSSKANVAANFDSFINLENELSLINFESYMSKFDEEEISEIKSKDVIALNSEDFDKVIINLKELINVSQKLNDNEILSFLEEKLTHVEENKNRINELLCNVDKVEDFVVLDETIKFFFKNKKQK